MTTMMEQERPRERVIGGPVDDDPEGAAAALYRRFGGEIYGFLLGFFGDRALADDGLQETFIKVIRQGEAELSELEQPRAWLYAVARRCAYDLLKRAHRRRERGFGSLGRSSATLAALVSPDRGWSVLEEAERRRLVEECLAGLPEEQRELLLLRVQELSYRDIGGVVGCSHPTAKKRVREAFAALTRALEARRILEEGDL